MCFCAVFRVVTVGPPARCLSPRRESALLLVVAAQPLRRVRGEVFEYAYRVRPGP